MRDLDRAEWQPMSSAPRDGTRILVTVRSSEQGPAAVDTAYWARSVRSGEEGWRASDSHADCVIIYAEAELMGWMLLPAPDPGRVSARSSPLWPEPMESGDPAESGGSGI